MNALNSSSTDLVVIGLGYVGLPLLVEASRAGFRCVGLDLNSTVVDGLNSGRSHVDDVTDETVAEMLAGGFVATTNADCLATTAAAVICVPTPLNEDQTPDLGAVSGAAGDIALRLRAGMLVVLESTTYPGTTDGLLREILETSGLAAGTDFALAFSPERIDPGNPTYQLRNTPKVVGGYTAACTERAVELYSQLVDVVVPVSGTREAEMSKLLENTYRHVNIALVNEIAVFSHDLGIDVWESLRAASTKPFGFTAFYPGPGVGGHCIPIDPNYLSHSVRSLGYQFKFVELAQEVSNRMPAYVVTRVQGQLNEMEKPVKNSKVLVLGLTYKPNIADDRETPARPVIRGLLSRGARVQAHDPHLKSFEVDGVEIDLAQDLDQALRDADIVVLLQAHSAYDLAHIADLSTAVFDTRGLMEGNNVERL